MFGSSNFCKVEDVFKTHSKFFEIEFKIRNVFVSSLGSSSAKKTEFNEFEFAALVCDMYF